MTSPDEDYEAEDAAWPTDPVDHADDYMSAQEDDWEAEFERLAFLEETAGMDSVDVYPTRRLGREEGKGE